MFLFRNAEQRAGPTLFILFQPDARPALHRVDLPQPAKIFTAPKHDFPQLMTSFACPVSFNQGQVCSSEAEQFWFWREAAPSHSWYKTGSCRIYGFWVRAQRGTAPNPSCLSVLQAVLSYHPSTDGEHWTTEIRMFKALQAHLGIP